MVILEMDYFSFLLPELLNTELEGFELVDLNYGLELGGLNAVDKKTLEMILASLNGMVEKNEAKAVFGVFSAPVQETLLTTSGIPCYSAWNVMRTVEGERPTFEHQRFCLTGRM